MKDKIEHSGVIDSITGDHVRVRIVQSAACSGCKAKSMCTSSESKEKFIDVSDSFSERWSVGEHVKVCGTLSMGKTAVRIAFGIPVLLIVVTLFFCKLAFGLSEGLSILFSFLVSGIYFCIVHSMREYLSTKFVMWIEKA